MGEWDDHPATQIRAFPFVGGDRILIADSDLYRRSWLRNVVAGLYGLEEVDHARDAFERLTADPPRVLVVGTDLVDISGGVLLSHAARHGLLGSHRGGPIVFLLADSPETAPQVDESQIPVFFRLTPNLQVERVRELLHQAFARQAPAQTKPASIEDAARSRQIIEHAKKLGAQQDLVGASAVVGAAVIDLTKAERARCLYYDDDSGSLWTETRDGSDEAQASAGVAGLAVRTGSAVVLERADSDPTYRPAVDDPSGNGSERLAVQPVADRDGRIHAVLIAVRGASEPPFSPSEQRALTDLAQAWGPFIHQLAVESEAQDDLDQRSAERGGDIFRQEAISHMITRGVSGDVVRVHPGWVSSAYWIVLVSLLAAVGFAAWAEIHYYSEGPSVVRFIGRTEVIAPDGGTVNGVEVTNGQEVKAQQILIRLHDTEEAGKLRGLDSEFERRLSAYLQTPGDPAARQALGQIVSERESAMANVDARVIRAPYDGVVKDVLVRNGQRIEPGKTVMSIGRKGMAEGVSVIAFLPGSDRPRLHAHQQMRLVLPGYRNAYLEMEIRGISAEVLGATEASARYLQRLGDSLRLSGTVVVVEARLASPEFEADGKRYELHDGMVGVAEVQLESRSVLEAVIPGLDQ